ncbi:MAG TPA: hypothetical protein VNW23_01080, partial [Opitutaceae bacterium]|nr:hypothetical protein [Opitutaceae bacterium]
LVVIDHISSEINGPEKLLWYATSAASTRRLPPTITFQRAKRVPGFWGDKAFALVAALAAALARLCFDIGESKSSGESSATRTHF